LLFTPSYSVVSKDKIISDEHVEFLWSGGQPALRGEGLVKHSLYQWDVIFNNGDYYKGGWAGQGLMVNPQRDIVAVFVSYKNSDESEMELSRIVLKMLDSVYGGT